MSPERGVEAAPREEGAAVRRSFRMAEVVRDGGVRGVGGVGGDRGVDPAPGAAGPLGLSVHRGGEAAASPAPGGERGTPVSRLRPALDPYELRDDLTALIAGWRVPVLTEEQIEALARRYALCPKVGMTFAEWLIAQGVSA